MSGHLTRISRFHKAPVGRNRLAPVLRELRPVTYRAGVLAR